MMINVPIKPTQTAAQRRGPTVSFKISGDRAVSTSGCTKKIAKASAMGRYFNAQKKKNVAAIKRLARKVWMPG